METWIQGSSLCQEWVVLAAPTSAAEQQGHEELPGGFWLLVFGRDFVRVRVLACKSRYKRFEINTKPTGEILPRSLQQVPPLTVALQVQSLALGSRRHW